MSFAGSYYGVLLQLGTTAFVARILTPEQTGIFAVAAVFMAVAVGWRDFGVAEFLIQKSEVTPAVLRASMAVNFASSWALALALMALAWPVGRFFGAEEIGQVMIIQALGLAMIPFGAVTLAWLRREMVARALLVSQLVAQSVQAVVTVAGVAAGWGVLALAWGGAAGILATVLVAECFRPNWFPRRPSWRGAGEILQFGRHASGVFVANQLGRGAPDLLIGRLEGLAAAGMFSRGNGVVELFNRLVVQAVQPVCLPYLADAKRQCGDLVPGLLRAMTIMTGVGLPSLALLGLAAYPAVRVMYGPQWMPAVPVAQLLCLAAAVELIYRFTEEALFAAGDARRAHVLVLQAHAARILGALIGLISGHGLIGVGVGLCLGSCAGAVLSHRALVARLGIDNERFVSALWPSVALTLLTGLPLVAMHLLWPVSEFNFLGWGVSALAVGSFAWLLAAAALAHPVWREIRRILTRTAP